MDLSYPVILEFGNIQPWLGCFMIVWLSHDFWPQFSSNHSEIVCVCRWPDKDGNAKFWWRSKSGSGSENFLKWFFTVWRWGQKLCTACYLEKLWMTVTKRGWWVGSVTRTRRFDFGSGLESDKTSQWKTKCKLFSLAEVCSLLSAVPFHQVPLDEWFFIYLLWDWDGKISKGNKSTSGFTISGWHGLLLTVFN